MVSSFLSFIPAHSISKDSLAGIKSLNYTTEIVRTKLMVSILSGVTVEISTSSQLFSKRLAALTKIEISINAGT